MEFQNGTVYPADLLRCSLDEERMAASVVVRVLYDVARGQLVPSREQPLLVVCDHWDSPFGRFEPDTVFAKQGVDLFVFGSVYPPNRRAIACTASIQVKNWERKVLVFGDRTWVAEGKELVPSAPAPFERMPVSLENAFGGVTEWDGIGAPYVLNPDGKGFYNSREDALGKPLPNFEEPTQRIARWDDRPDPAGLGFCPLDLGLRAREAMRVSERGMEELRSNPLLQTAFPRMVAPPIAPGDIVRLTHFTSGGVLELRAPAPGCVVRMKIGANMAEKTLAIDQIGIDADAGKAFVTFRYPFRYHVRERDERSCILGWPLPSHELTEGGP